MTFSQQNQRIGSCSVATGLLTIYRSLGLWNKQQRRQIYNLSWKLFQDPLELELRLSQDLKSCFNSSTFRYYVTKNKSKVKESNKLATKEMNGCWCPKPLYAC